MSGAGGRTATEARASDGVGGEAHAPTVGAGRGRGQRTVLCMDTNLWLETARLPPRAALVTSLPDTSEVAGLGFEAWRDWFVQMARRLLELLEDDAVGLFYQTDIKREGVWVDKAYLVQKGAEAAGMGLLFHKVVCRAPAGTTTFGRPAYAHLLAFSRILRLTPAQSTADVLPQLGAMTWARAMGLNPCVAAVRFARDVAGARVIVDPFCGVGTALAVANALGLDALGVEKTPKRARAAEALVLDVS